MTFAPHIKTNSTPDLYEGGFMNIDNIPNIDILKEGMYVYYKVY
jgi:hypothetical protein